MAWRTPSWDKFVSCSRKARTNPQILLVELRSCRFALPNRISPPCHDPQDWRWEQRKDLNGGSQCARWFLCATSAQTPEEVGISRCLMVHTLQVSTEFRNTFHGSRSHGFSSSPAFKVFAFVFKYLNTHEGPCFSFRPTMATCMAKCESSFKVVGFEQQAPPHQYYVRPPYCTATPLCHISIRSPFSAKMQLGRVRGKT